MGTIAIRLPSSSFAATARSLLEDAIGVFAKAPEEYCGGPKIKVRYSCESCNKLILIISAGNARQVSQTRSLCQG
jgi:hypothetical protein